jgi:Fic-DOC domain mobile mystery protein B
MPIFEPIEGATPIDDISGLIPTHITTKAELDEWESANILKAVRKYLTSAKKQAITIEWLKKVHKDMFDDTWKWAGKFRTKSTNVGVDPHRIREEIKKLVDDINFLKKDKNGMSLFEQSVRVHHRLVFIHPFENGNGRHARLVADIFLSSHGEKLPSWPDEELIKRTNVRTRYIKALQDADQGNYKPLEDLTKSLIK